jgi:replication factor C subunit 3/5
MEALWSEKYRPDSFEALDFHEEISSQFQNLIQQGDMPHLVLYGPDGAGKRTRVNCLLSKLYGRAAIKPVKDVFTFKNNSTTIEIPIRTSKFHIELTPSDADHNDRLVLMKLIKDSASNSGLLGGAKNNFMTFVLYEAENLTHAAQAALRRTMEKYSGKIRIVLVCQFIGKLIPALKSRCLMIRVPAPTQEKVVELLEVICNKEHLGYEANKELKKIADASQRNLRKAILLLQTAATTRNLGDEVLQDYWKQAVKRKLFEPINKEQSVEVVKNCRSAFFELLVNQVPASEIIKEMLVLLLENSKNEVQNSAMKEVAVFCEKALKQGDREIIYLEAFLVKIMIILRTGKYPQ